MNKSIAQYRSLQMLGDRQGVSRVCEDFLSVTLQYLCAYRDALIARGDAQYSEKYSQEMQEVSRELCEEVLPAFGIRPFSSGDRMRLMGAMLRAHLEDLVLLKEVGTLLLIKDGEWESAIATLAEEITHTKPSSESMDWICVLRGISHSVGLGEFMPSRAGRALFAKWCNHLSTAALQ